MKEKLSFQMVSNCKKLVAETTYQRIDECFTEEEKENILVAEINPDYMDGGALFEHYQIDKQMGVNCLICECKRSENKTYVALLVPTGYRYNMSTTVRRYTNARIVSVAPLDYVLQQTKMEYGSINPIGLPKDWKILIDSKVLDSDRIICGSGLQYSKLSLPSNYIFKLDNVEVLENLAKD